MTTDELLMKLPSHIGRNRINGFYLWDNQRNDSIGWLYLHNDGKDWCASYGTEGHFVCLNPNAEKPPYNNAVRYGKTPNEALQSLYYWCIENGFIKEE